MTITRIAIYAFCSVVAGFFLMVPLASLFDWMRWPHFNAWSLAHGAFVLAWPLMTCMAFPIVAYVGQRMFRWMGR
jgi:hypothetical protein